jgi:uncharacterized protein
MKTIVIAGGTGYLGQCLTDHFRKGGDKVIILTRGNTSVKDGVHYLNWNGKDSGHWTDSLNNCDVLINLNGKSVDCRYTERNKALIYSTRLDATEALGNAILQCKTPPKLWINAASATIYRHSLDKEMDEHTGEIGEGFSVDVCQQWEAKFNRFELPETRKVIIRTSIVLGKKAWVFKPFKLLAKLGLGGTQGSGNQYISWLHDEDFTGIIDFIIAKENVAGVYNLAAPEPTTNRQFLRLLRKEVGMPFGLPMPEWLIAFGAVIIRTEPELVLKSRRVVPGKLLDAGYKFKYTNIEEALKDLV